MAQDLTDPAKTPLDLYGLLQLPSPAANPSIPTPNTNTVKKAYRKAALVSHPDKAPPEEREKWAEKFHRLSLAHDILIDENLRAVYDARLEKERRSKAEKEAFTKKRRQMMDELQKRESAGRDGFLNTQQAASDGWQTPVKAHNAGMKRTHSGNASSGFSTPLSSEQEQERKRLAAEGARRRAEFEERKKRRRSGLDQDVKNAANGNDTPVQRPDGTPLQHTPSRNGFGVNTTPSSAHVTQNGVSPKKAPSFLFASAAGKGPSEGKSQGLGSGASPSAPGGSLFESTMAKMREAQKRKEMGAVRNSASATAQDTQV